MSEFLDELARSLAKPMPRSRALRLLGTSIVAAAVPLAGPRLRPARASGFSTANCSDPGLCSGLPGRTKVCGCDFLASCYKECCNPATEHCCLYPPFPGATGGSSVCEKACCPLGTDCGTASKPCVPKKSECRGSGNRITSVKTASGNDYGLTNTSFRVGQRVTATEATTLTFGDGSVIRLDKGTSFEVDRCNDNQPSDPTVLELLIGKLWRAAKSAATGGQTFQVETQRAGTGVRGTTFWISYLPAKKQTTLHVVKGSVEMWRRSTPKRKLLVKTGQTAVQQGSALPRITKR